MLCYPSTRSQYHTATKVSKELLPGTPWGGFDPSHHPPLLFWAPPGDYRSEPFGPGLLNRDSHNYKYFIVLIMSPSSQQITVGRSSSLWLRWRADETVPRAALVSCELRAALVRSGQAGAPQRGQGDGRKVLRTGGFDDEGIYTKVLKWNLLEFTRIYFFGGDYTKSQS